MSPWTPASVKNRRRTSSQTKSRDRNLSEASQQSQESSRSVEFVNFMRIIIKNLQHDCRATYFHIITYFYANPDIQSYEYLVFRSTSPWTVEDYIQSYLVFRFTSSCTVEDFIQPYLVFRSTSP